MKSHMSEKHKNDEDKSYIPNISRRSAVKSLSVSSVLVGANIGLTGGAAAESKDENISVSDSGQLSNGDLTIQVNNNGTWQIKTAGGEDLTFPRASTSGLTIQIDGTNYVYGQPTGTNLDQFRTQDTQFSSSGSEAITKWQINGVIISQNIRLSGKAATFNISIKNSSNSDINAKVRWLFDYQVSEQDGAPIFANGQVLTSETRYNSPNFNNYKTYSSIPNPSLTGEGNLITTPTKIEFVAWEDAESSGYQYSGFDSAKSFYTQGFDNSPESDSAGLIYYDLGTISPGNSESVQTSYGVGPPTQNRVEGVELAMDGFRDSAVDALNSMANQRAKAHAAIYSRVGEDYADQYINYFGYNAGISAISRSDVNSEIRAKLDEILGDLDTSQYEQLYEFFNAMFGAVNTNASQSTMELVFSDFFKGIATEQTTGSAPQLQIGGQSIKEIESNFISNFNNRKTDAINTLQNTSLNSTEISRIIDYYNTKATKLDERANTIEQKVDRAISKISNGETGRVHGSRVKNNVNTTGNSINNQALAATGTAAYMTVKFAGATLSALSLSSLFYTSTTTTSATITGVYSGGQLASSLSWTLPSMTYWSSLQSINSAAPSLKAVVKGVVSDQVLQEFNLTPSQIIEDYTGIKIDLLLGVGSPFTTLASITTDQIQEVAADVTKTIDIVDIDAPNVASNNISSEGEASATATVEIENTSSESITPILVNSASGVQTTPLHSDFIGKIDLDSTVFNVDMPEIPPGQSRSVPVTYKFPTNYIVGNYTLKLTISPTSTEAGSSSTASDPFITANIPSNITTDTLLNQAIQQGNNIREAYNSQSNAENLDFNLSYPGSNLDLHVYDNSNNHVGLNYQTGDFENEIQGAKASGPDNSGQPRESVRIANPNNEYETEVVAIDTDGDESFSVTATNIPSIPPRMNIVSPSTRRTDSGNLVTIPIKIRETGDSSKLTNVTLSKNELVSQNTQNIPEGNVSIGQSGFDVNAGEIKTVNVDVAVPNYASGAYSGNIQVSSVQTSSSVEIKITTIPAGAVYNDPFVAQYDNNGSGTISQTELGTAGRDYLNGNISQNELGKVGRAYLNS